MLVAIACLCIIAVLSEHGCICVYRICNGGLNLVCLRPLTVFFFVVVVVFGRGWGGGGGAVLCSIVSI